MNLSLINFIMRITAAQKKKWLHLKNDLDHILDSGYKKIPIFFNSLISNDFGCVVKIAQAKLQQSSL